MFKVYMPLLCSMTINNLACGVSQYNNIAYCWHVYILFMELQLMHIEVANYPIIIPSEARSHDQIGFESM